MGLIKIKHKKNNNENVSTPNEQDIVEKTEKIDEITEQIPDTDMEQLGAEDDDMEQVDILSSDRAVVSEDESQTTENSRMFYLNNGTAVSVISATPTNYFDEQEKKWKNVDNTLTDIGDEYQSNGGAFKTSISKAEKKRAVRVGKKDLQVMWEFKGKKKKSDAPDILSAMKDKFGSVLEKITEGAERLATTLEVGTKRDAERKPSKRKHRRLFDRAVYNNVENNTDLEYCLFGDHIKENIIIKEKSDDYRYVFALQTQGLKMRLSEDNLQIELYREKTAADGTVEQAVEFTIPAPYMYDAAGNTCEEVYFEIEPTADGQCAFSVVANAEWINAEDRAMPVTIDPQIVVNIGSLITKRTERRSISIDSCLGKVPGSWNTYNSSDILVKRSSSEEIRTILTVKRSRIKLLNKRIASAVLYLTNSRSAFTSLYTDGVWKWVNGYGKLEIDLTSKFQSGETTDIEIILSADAESEARFYATTNAPYIKVEYLTNENLKECKRDIDLVNNVTGKLDVATGEFTPEIFIASGEGLSLEYGITQVYKQSSENFSCGTNFRLNLHERLEQFGGRYIYTDMYGIKHGFDEHFYYIDENGVKTPVEKYLVSITPLGDMYYGDKEVFREEVSDSGLRASTRLQNISGLYHFEQRESEIKQLEDQIAQYKNALEQFVVVNTCTNEIVYRFKGNLDNLNYPTSCTVILPENEAYSMLGMILQREALGYQDASYNIQNESLNISKGLDGVSDEQKNNYGKQIDNNTNMQSNNSKQKSLVQKQIDNIPRKSVGYIEQIDQYYKEYVSKKAELEMRKRLTPVHYILAGEIIKGFNEDGELVVISDQYNNAIAIERDSKGRITRVYDDKEKQILFDYNCKGLLSSVTDVRGRRTAITRSGRTTTLSYANGKTLMFTTSVKTTQNNGINYENITEITEAQNIEVKLSYDNTLLTKIEYYGLFNAISHGSITPGNTKLSETEIAYSPNQTVITTSGDITELEMYKFNVEGNLSEHYVEKDGKVVQAEQYDYVKNSHDNVRYARKDTLNKMPLSSFRFDAGESTNVTLNKFNKPVNESTGWKNIHISANGTTTKQKTDTTYTYDEDNRVISERSVLSTQKGSSAVTTVTTLKTYSYNAQGNVVRTESYVVGEELTAGKSIEETVFDDKGRVAKSFTYNSLDSSSKFYKESETDENGKVTVEVDETGENKTKLEYADNSNNVSTKTLPNGGKFSYGYDIDDNVTSITQSTDNGEENSTQTEYTNGEVTKLTSGNNTVKYTYDYKRRKRNVYFNSDTPYTSFTYSDKITKNGKIVNKVTALYLNCDTAETVNDMNGNVLSTSYNNDEQTICEYDSDNRLIKRTDGVTKTIATFAYDTFDKTTRYSDGSVTETYTYNEDGNLDSLSLKFGDITDTYTYAYKSNAAKDLSSITVRNATISPTTDVFGRNTGKTIDYAKDRIAEEVIYYRKVGDHSTNMPVSMRFGDKGSGQYAVMDHLQYKYDNCGNIAEVRSNGILKIRYAYDKLNRLIREDNKEFGKTWLYAYDNNGNILSKREFAFTLKNTERLEELDGKTVMYGYMGDVLLSYGEEKCAYDNLGNPIVYRDNDIRWEKRRQVVAYGGVSFKYDGHGRRIEKNGISFTYDSNGKLLKQSNGLSFIYDNNGVVGLTYNGSTYFYRKDIQGNIIAILDSTGTVVVEYTYNAWGEHTIETLDESYDELSQLNPFRYRGYYYDSETGLYFLKTRYYDPETGRFISIDDISYVDPESINGLNLYAYCGNNPVMNVDPNGTFFLSILIATIAGAVISAGVSIVKQGVTNGWNNINWREVGASALLGGVMGGITAFGGALFLTPSLITAGGVLASIGGVVAVSFGAGVGAYAIRYAGKDQFNLGEMIIAGIDATFQGIANFMMGFAMGATGHYVDLQKGFKLLDVLPVSKTLSNSLLANTNSLFMNYILNHVIRGACKMLNGLVFGNLHKAFI